TNVVYNKVEQFTPTHPKEKNMTVLTIHEQQEIDRANTEEKQPVVFVHGLWLLASSWDNWRQLFEEQGYTTLAPGWPDDPDTVEEAKHDPEVFAHKRIKQVTDHYVDESEAHALYETYWVPGSGVPIFQAATANL